MAGAGRKWRQQSGMAMKNGENNRGIRRMAAK
jgi:hypothetical protein